MKPARRIAVALLSLIVVASPVFARGGGHARGGHSSGGRSSHRSSGGHHSSHSRSSRRASSRGHASRGHRPSSAHTTASTTAGTTSAERVHVNGYTRKDGTYVAPHDRTKANGTKADNWSTRGNLNPDTGKKGTKALAPAKPPVR